MNNKEQINHRFLAIYLPQYYPIPENDRWWGKGFTEWANVVKVTPRFKGHYQPRLPSELGFYDLRVPEIREAQADLAKQYGIDGFAYYHYWFSGKRLLNRPLDEVLKTQSPDLPFCLIWANETWSSTWGPTYGSTPVDRTISEVLIEQNYSPKDDIDHIRWLASVFRDKRYIHVQDKPLFIVYRPSLLPDARSTIKRWRNEAEHLGIRGLYLCMMQAFPEDRVDPSKVGFDASIQFLPDRRIRDAVLEREKEMRKIRRILPFIGGSATEIIIKYSDLTKGVLSEVKPPYKRYPCLMPSWDNSARRDRGATIYNGSTPDLYEDWVYKTMLAHPPYGTDENFIFVNSWNEWAEGSYLEPDCKWNRGYLEAHLRAVRRYKENNDDS